MKRRELAWVLALLMCLTLMAGCSGGGKQSAPSAAVPTQAQAPESGEAEEPIDEQLKPRPTVDKDGYAFLTSKVNVSATIESQQVELESEFHFDGAGHLLYVSLDNEYGVSFDYDGDQIIRSHLLESGEDLCTGSYVYSSDGQLASITGKNLVSGETNELTFSYNQRGLLESVSCANQFACFPESAFNLRFALNQTVNQPVFSAFEALNRYLSETYWELEENEGCVVTLKYQTLLDGSARIKDVYGESESARFMLLNSFVYNADGTLQRYAEGDWHDEYQYDAERADFTIRRYEDDEAFADFTYDCFRNTLECLEYSGESSMTYISRSGSSLQMDCTESSGSRTEMSFQRIPLTDRHVAAMPWLIVFG